MTDGAFNAAEQFLLKKWNEAYQLEQTMERVREKYSEVWTRIRDRVREEPPNLDWAWLRLTQKWAPGYAWFGRKSWPGADDGRAAGVWFENLRLEVLSEPSEPPPEASFWIDPLQKTGLDTTPMLKVASTRVASIPKDDAQRLGIRPGSGDKLAVCSMPSKEELLAMLLERDGTSFIDAIVERIAALAQFSDLVDDALSTDRKKPK